MASYRYESLCSRDGFASSMRRTANMMALIWLRLAIRQMNSLVKTTEREAEPRVKNRRLDRHGYSPLPRTEKSIVDASMHLHVFRDRSSIMMAARVLLNTIAAEAAAVWVTTLSVHAESCIRI